MLQEASGAAGHPSYRRYHYGAGPLLVEDGGTRRFISTDALGSTTDLTTTGGTVASMRKYDAWGQYRNDTAPQANEPKLGFTGHQYDPETGLVYARARYYDPDIGRFISRDINEGSIANAPSLHRYSYAHGNPTVYVDKDGQSATVVGTALGFAWGTGQAIGGLIALGLQGLTGGAIVSNVHSIGDALGLVAQNTIGGFEVGLSLDMAAASGGLAVAAGSGALGFAGADALTLQGKARSASDFAISQVVEGGKGAAVGVGLGVVGKGVSAVAKTAVGEFVVREAVEAVGAVAKTSAGQAVTGAARATAAKVVPALRALGAEADEAAVDVGLGWMPNAGKSVAAKLNAAEAVVKQELATAWSETKASFRSPGPGAKDARIEWTLEGERFVRVGAGPQNLRFTFDTPGGSQPGTYAFPEGTFNEIGRDPAALKNYGDLPGAPPRVFRVLEPPPGTPIQRGIVPGGEYGGEGGVPEVLFPEGF